MGNLEDDEVRHLTDEEILKDRVRREAWRKRDEEFGKQIRKGREREEMVDLLSYLLPRVLGVALLLILLAAIFFWCVILK